MTPQDSQISFADMRGYALDEVRRKLRRNLYSKHTAGLCAGRLQCNLVILPEAFAGDFYRFCQANPKACPLIAHTQPGATHFGGLDEDVDLRFDVPAYRLYRDGTCTGEVQDIENLWQDRFVSFAIGCSFSFETALAARGISLRHIEENKTVPMYRTNMQTQATGPFGGQTVVSMRPIHRDTVPQVVSICAHFPHAHGAPLHIGDPAEIGIADVAQPDWGAAVTVRDQDVPVFWGCGVTSQLAVMQAKPSIAITHAPGAMLILNVPDSGAVQNTQ